MAIDEALKGSYDEVEVSVQEISYVKPETPTANRSDVHDRLLFLASLDLYWTEFWYNRRLLFYKLLNVHEQSLMIAKLKSSLAELLVHFYPAAGRLAVGPDGRTGIDCDDQGAEFVVASVDVSLAGLHTTSFEPCEFFNKLARYAKHDVAQSHEIPLLSFQITKFTCGGLAIGYAHSHALADGQSMWHLMNSWAECARNEGISVKPVHDRTPFKIEKPSEEMAASLNLPPCRTEAAGEIGPVKPQEPTVEKLFHVTPTLINKLKQEAGASPEMSRGFSTFEVLCGHWWRSVMKARNLEDTEMTRFAVLADMRSRVTPPLPPAYFGNAIIFAFANAPYAELKGEPLGSAALKIHKASKDCNEQMLWAKMHWLELHGNKFGSRIQWTGSYMNVASSPRFNVYGVDFGWGKPVAVRTVHANGDGETVLFPGRESGLDVCMPLAIPAMERLIRDPDFLPTSCT